MINEILKLELPLRYNMRGEDDAVYDFNMLPFTSSLIDVADRFCDDYSGVYILAVCSGQGNPMKMEYLHCGSVGDMKKALYKHASEQSLDGANCLLYYYEPSELVRNDVHADILAANKFVAGTL